MQAILSRKASIDSTESKRGVAMERRMYAGAESITILVVLVLAIGVDAQSIYACWGACYNNCFTRAGETQTQRLSCDYQCLNSCIPRSANDLKFYCQIGCSLKRCIPDSIDGARLESCFGWCTNLCNEVLAP